MARTRKTWPTETGEGRRSYPWAQWLDGSIWFLEAGKDYTCSTTAMRSQVGMRCNAAGLEYRTHRAADGSGLYVQTFPGRMPAHARGYTCDNCGGYVSPNEAREAGDVCVHGCPAELGTLSEVG